MKIPQPDFPVQSLMGDLDSLRTRTSVQFPLFRTCITVSPFGVGEGLVPLQSTKLDVQKTGTAEPPKKMT